GAAVAGAPAAAVGQTGAATKPAGGPSSTQSAGAAQAEPVAGTAATRQLGAATKKLVRVGSVGTFSGPVGAVVKDTTTGLRVWAQWVNSHGGLNGHPVEVLVGDDGGDPGRYNFLLKQFVELKGVIAFLYNTLGFAPAGNNKYLDSVKIFSFGSEGGTEVAYTNPYVLTSTPTGRTNADSMLLALGHAMNSTGSTKLAGFACSDFALCDNFDASWGKADVLRKAGFQSVARGRPSMTQPDYTAQCLAAKQAGAEVLIFGMDTSAIRRFAGDCARQGFRPRLSTADLLALPTLPLDPNVDGMVIGTKMAPFTDTRVPGIKECYDAFAKFAPGAEVSGSHVNGWIIGEYFAAAAANLPDDPTPRDVEDGVYSIKNNNLKGMTYPITMTRGQPQARQLCYGAVVIRDRKYTTLPGPSLYCEKSGKPLANPDDY
ncbi:ABC transporter substrate-binding protein, partial [Sporichthya sp.]|uniref:ABC transporter substrate-binding protein n=1 Tax=Sporichthya sp. TaxID=65475 RepID=UPI0017FCF0AD